MKLNITSKLLLAALLLFTARAGMAGVLAKSAHDFSTAGWNTSQKICVACHTPHFSDTTVSSAPLWNHTNSTQTYTLYTSPTLQSTMGQPGGNSKLCLSCHDGTVAIDSFGGAGGTTMITNAAYKATSNIGTALNNDHPIGITYNAALVTKNPTLYNPDTQNVTIGSSPTKTGTITATLLYNGQMECSSCHDVHNTFAVGANGTGMVKMAAAGSAICLACHNK